MRGSDYMRVYCLYYCIVDPLSKYFVIHRYVYVSHWSGKYFISRFTDQSVLSVSRASVRLA